MAEDSIYAQGLPGSAPSSDFSDFSSRFQKTLTKYLKKGGADFITKKDNKYVWHEEHLDKRTPLNLSKQVADTMPDFSFNQFTLKDFYDKLRQSNMYTGMFEGIGRAAIHASFNVPMPFNKFMQAPLEFGDAVLDAVFTDLHSRPWIKDDEDKSLEAGLDNSRPLLFKTQRPEMLTSVARCEFRREIPLKINENEYKQFVQTGTMMGEVAGAMAGGVAYCHQRDLYEAAKEYFLGCIRIKEEPKHSTAAGKTNRMEDSALENNSMVDIITIKSTEKLSDKCQIENFQTILHEIVENQFYFPSKKYNPFEKETSSQSISLIMSSKYNYPLFSRWLAETYHPDNLSYKMGPSLDIVWVDNIPQLVDGIYPSNHELIAMVVDDRAIGIIPVTPYSVGAFYNPQETSNSLFAHYEYIFKFIPFYNRKYIFLKTTT